MEFIKRKIFLENSMVAADLDGDGINDSLVLSSTTKTVQISLKQDIDDIGVFTDFEEEPPEVVDMGFIWNTTNDGSNDSVIDIFGTGTTTTFYPEDELINSGGTFLIQGCKDPTAINFSSGATIDCGDCCQYAFSGATGGGGTTGSDLVSTGDTEQTTIPGGPDFVIRMWAENIGYGTGPGTVKRCLNSGSPTGSASRQCGWRGDAIKVEVRDRTFSGSTFTPILSQNVTNIPNGPNDDGVNYIAGNGTFTLLGDVGMDWSNINPSNNVISTGEPSDIWHRPWRDIHLSVSPNEILRVTFVKSSLIEGGSPLQLPLGFRKKLSYEIFESPAATDADSLMNNKNNYCASGIISFCNVCKTGGSGLQPSLYPDGCGLTNRVFVNGEPIPYINGTTVVGSEPSEIDIYVSP